MKDTTKITLCKYEKSEFIRIFIFVIKKPPLLVFRKDDFIILISFYVLQQLTFRPEYPYKSFTGASFVFSNTKSKYGYAIVASLPCGT